MSGCPIVVPQLHRLDAPLMLDCGRALEDVIIEYETYGEFSPEKDNAILVCHGLAGNAHAAGFRSPGQIQPGWWDVAIGPGRMFDTDRFFVIATTALAGCGATTGPPPSIRRQASHTVCGFRV